MSKLAWVLLPLLTAALAWALLLLRGRAPSRGALNIWSSVLLLAYVAVTAGLGVFWVAQQQLPVFDWHYLFGYATVLLLLVHLTFNFPRVWRHWQQAAQRRWPPRLWRQRAVHTRRQALSTPAAEGRAQPAAIPATAHGRGPRGVALGLVGAGLLAVGTFMLGLRQGRTELRVEGPAGSTGSAAGGTGAGAAAGAAGLAVVERFHEFSSHSRLGVFRRAPAAQWGTPPPAFKHWEGLEEVALPPAQLDGAAVHPPSPPDLARLATLLYACAGVNLRRGAISFRCSPSSGALFASELYIDVRQVAGLAPGLYHYHGAEHRLRRLRPAAAGNGTAAIELYASAVFRRTGHKYGDRTYRFVLADLGHLLENLRAAAAVLGLQARPVLAFDEELAAARLALDQAEEGVLARWQIGAEVGPPAHLMRPLPAHSWRAAPWAIAAPLGVTDAIHRATSLRAASAATGRNDPSAAASSVGGTDRSHPVPAPVCSLPEVPPAAMPLLQRIARRRSGRRFSSRPLPLGDLAALLDAAARRVAPLLSAAVRVDLLSAAVQGLPQAVWRYEPDRHVLVQRQHVADLRRRARSAALEQDVIGDAAVVFVLSIDRATFAADPAGAGRGYRHAFLEAGLVGERLYLEATARGLHVCGVGAFYDDETSELMALDPASEWVLHLTAAGQPE